MKKIPIQSVDMPRCEHCNAAEFKPGADHGECHLLPMEWVYIGEGETVARYRGCVPDGWCRHFERKVH
jgi:hypothetical protein